MTPGGFERAALALPGATLSIQWGDDRVYKVGGKMFAVLAGESQRKRTASFKCNDLSFEMLTQKPGIAPAPYLARAKWVMLEHLRALPDEEIRARIGEAYKIVAAGLPKKLRPALQG